MNRLRIVGRTRRQPQGGRPLRGRSNGLDSASNEAPLVAVGPGSSQPIRDLSTAPWADVILVLRLGQT
jgi:hypothetical protein